MPRVPDQFWSDLAEDLEDPEFLREYIREGVRIGTIDQVVRELDDARETAGLSKAELARSLGTHGAAVRRLFSAEQVNPTLGTLAEVAAVLGLRVTLVPLDPRERKLVSQPLREGQSRDPRAVAKHTAAMRSSRKPRLVS